MSKGGLRGPTAIVRQDGTILVRQVEERRLKRLDDFYQGLFHRSMLRAQMEFESTLSQKARDQLRDIALARGETPSEPSRMTWENGPKGDE